MHEQRAQYAVEEIYELTYPAEANIL